MTCCTGDRLGPKLEALLGCVQAALAECGVPVCRSFISTAKQVPWDVCCACSGGVGQLWVSVDDIEPISNGIEQQRCSTQYQATVWIGILRCALTVADDGTVPDADDLSNEALEVLADRLAIVQAVRCCYGEAHGPDEWTLSSWESLGPQGGCLGGRQKVIIRFADPKCS